jgi:hypothetical protein
VNSNRNTSKLNKQEVLKLLDTGFVTLVEFDKEFLNQRLRTSVAIHITCSYILHKSNSDNADSFPNCSKGKCQVNQRNESIILRADYRFRTSYTRCKQLRNFARRSLDLFGSVYSVTAAEERDNLRDRK